MNYDDDRPLGLIVLAVLALSAGFLLTSCEKKHVGDTYIVNSKPDDGSSSNVEINRDNSNNDNANANANK